MPQDKSKTNVPLNSPMHKNRNPSWRKHQRHESKYKVQDYAWQPGNSPFRRYANGMLDYASAASKVIECLDLARDGGYLNEMDKAMLSVIIPGLDNLVPKGIAKTQIKLAPEEIAKLRLLISAKNREALNWNAGRGGGSVPMRTVTTS